MRKDFFQSVAIIFILLISDISCQKKDKELCQDSFSVSSAKTWYSDFILKPLNSPQKAK
jgi:hypothetical protein